MAVLTPSTIASNCEHASKKQKAKHQKAKHLTWGSFFAMVSPNKGDTMKKLYAVAVVVALALPVLAWSATPYTSSFKDGKFEGTITSVIPDLNNKKVTAEVKHEGDKVVMTVSYEGGKEIWAWDDKSLMQKEVDLKTGKVTQEYGATAAKTPATNEQTFNVNCKDKAKNDCDVGIDSRNYWTLKTSPTEITYLVYGVSKDKKADATAKAEKRHEFTFKFTK